MTKSKSKSIICHKCQQTATIKLGTFYRHLRKYGHTYCVSCSKQFISASTTALWDDKGFRERIVAAGKRRDRSQLSASAIKKWQDPAYRAKMERLYNSESYRLKMAGVWNRPGFAEQYVVGLDEFVRRSKLVHNDFYSYDHAVYVSAQVPLTITCPDHGDFSQTPHSHLYNKHGCSRCAATSSGPQQQIVNFIKTFYDGEIVINDRKQLSPHELDIFIPEHKLAIEHHGVYWHSHSAKETVLERNYHTFKATLATHNGIRLLQVFESEWLHQRPIVESMIGHLFKKSRRVSARCCQIEEISQLDYGNFMDKNHLQGNRPASYRCGLICDGQLISALGISKHPTFEYELIRYASAVGCCVVGGLSKLLTAAKTKLNFKKLLTYADRRYSNSNAYLAVGFKPIGTTKPNYCYVRGNKTFSRQTFQKHKLVKRLPQFDPNLSESENMFINGYRRMWDAGHHKLVLSMTS